ncbi:MAG: glycosyltransferase, partial [Woeseiaceae bacterium]
LPVITTTAGGLDDIVTAEQTAIVFPVADVGALEAAIERVVCDGAELQAIVAAGRESVIRRYSQPRVLDQYAALLEKLRESGDARGLVS